MWSILERIWRKLKRSPTILLVLIIITFNIALFFRLDRPKKTIIPEALIGVKGERILVRPGTARGFTDNIIVRDSSHVEFSGWAFDVTNSRLPEGVLITYDGEHIYLGQSLFNRAAVAEAYGEAALKSSFRFVLPLRMFKVQNLDTSMLRLFAISKGVASELPYVKNGTYNFLDNLENAVINTQSANLVRVSGLAVNNDQRTVLLEHPHSQVVFQHVPININAELRFGIGISQGVWELEGDGVMFKISIVDDQLEQHVLFSKYIDPKNNVKHRKWFDEKINLSTLAGQMVSFVFETTGGPNDDTIHDWAGWSGLLLVPNVMQKAESSREEMANGMR